MAECPSICRRVEVHTVLKGFELEHIAISFVIEFYALVPQFCFQCIDVLFLSDLNADILAAGFEQEASLWGFEFTFNHFLHLFQCVIVRDEPQRFFGLLFIIFIRTANCMSRVFLSNQVILNLMHEGIVVAGAHEDHCHLLVVELFGLVVNSMARGFLPHHLCQEFIAQGGQRLHAFRVGRRWHSNRVAPGKLALQFHFFLIFLMDQVVAIHGGISRLPQISIFHLRMLIAVQNDTAIPILHGNAENLAEHSRGQDKFEPMMPIIDVSMLIFLQGNFFYFEISGIDASLCLLHLLSQIPTRQQIATSTVQQDASKPRQLSLQKFLIRTPINNVVSLPSPRIDLLRGPLASQTVIQVMREHMAFLFNLSPASGHKFGVNFFEF